jgi:hypothetical protein
MTGLGVQLSLSLMWKKTENRVLRRIFGPKEEEGKLCDEEPYNLYS